MNQNRKKSKDVGCKPGVFYDYCVRERDSKDAADDEAEELTMSQA